MNMTRYVWMLFIIALTAGCARLQPVDLTEPDVAVPKNKVVLFFVDGINRDVFRQMLADDQLPAIDTYFCTGGARVDNAVTVVPSITYAVSVSLITGLAPGHHGILGNHYFDRHRLFFANYNTISTYRNVDHHYHVPTIYDLLDDRFTVSIQTAVRRGVSHNIDNWASSGIRWYFDQIPEIDALVAERFLKIKQLAATARRWPELIYVYMPAVDEMGHRYGPESPQYHAALINADQQIGRICRALEESNLLDSTYLLFVSDHGMAPLVQGNGLHIAEVLRDDFDLRVTTNGPNLETIYPERAAYYQQFNAILAQGGDRRAMIYLRNGLDWAQPAPPNQIQPIARRLLQHPAVALVAWQQDDDTLIANQYGTTVIRSRLTPGLDLNHQLYQYRVIDGSDPLGYADALRADGLLDDGYHPGSAWLAATVKTRYPDLPVALSTAFASHRAGDLIIFAADGWDFSGRNHGGHGSVRAVDMMVPMMIAGPGIEPGSHLPVARIVDVAPTIIDMLDDKTEKQVWDGHSLLHQLQGR